MKKKEKSMCVINLKNTFTFLIYLWWISEEKGKEIYLYNL